MMSQFAQDIIANGKPEWLRQGERKGHQEGVSTVLLLQLESKFGVISESIRNKVLAADRASLEQWSIRILKANTLDAVFGSDFSANH